MSSTPFSNPENRGFRRLNPDGTCDIKCRICGKKICTRLYDRFSTATCATCYNGELAGMTPEEIIYRTQQAELAQLTQAQEEVGPSNFKAVGFRKRVADVLGAIKERIAKKHRDVTRE